MGDFGAAFAAGVGPIVGKLRAQGQSLRQIAAELVARGIRTPRGGVWSAAAVRAVLGRVRETRVWCRIG